MPDRRHVDLRPEAALASSRMKAGRIRWLDAMACLPGFVYAGGVGEGRVKFLSGGLYQPIDDADAVEALLLGCWSDLPSRSELIDLVAIQIGGPGCWGSRLGIAVALGVSTVSPFSGAAVPVSASPWRWLRAGGSGLWFPNPTTADARDLLLQFALIHAEDVEHGRQLRDLLHRPLPRIMVPDVARVA